MVNHKLFGDITQPHVAVAAMVPVIQDGDGVIIIIPIK
tara:strand:+ start:172 stop:285 length:114 start_codon:yes stop_codon:yes gene_type:complete